MARIRSIKPEFWQDEDVAGLSLPARLLYIATWNEADDEGLLRWNAPYLKSTAFIYDDIDVSEVQSLMAEIVAASFVVSYSGGKTQQRLGWIPSFRTHQKPNRPQPSKLPPPSLQNPQIRVVYGERDDWICHICTDPIPHGVVNVDPYSSDGVSADLLLSLDHVLPRVEGGSDYPSNIRAAHKRCNSSKGSRTDWDSEPFTEPFTEPDIAVGEGRVGEGSSSGGVQGEKVLSLTRGLLKRVDDL